MRVSVLVCTPDSTTERFRKCYDAIIATTKGISFDLRIVDNRKTTEFSQQREINMATRCASGPVINMDDDVVVEGDWFPALLEEVRPEVGMACCSTYTSKPITERIIVPTTGLCCTLLNVPVWPTRQMISYEYKKYFFDPDLCLSLWQHDLQSIVIPNKIVHDSGGGMRELRINRKPLFDYDKVIFRQNWIDSGKYEIIKLRHGHLWDAPINERMYA